MNRPEHIELRKDEGLELRWPGGREDFIPLAQLRRMSPSADAKQLREEIASNPLAILPSSAQSNGPLRAIDAELIGNYAIRITFSDGHDTGLYTWAYLRELADQSREKDPPNAPPEDFPNDHL